MIGTVLTDGIHTAKIIMVTEEQGMYTDDRSFEFFACRHLPKMDCTTPGGTKETAYVVHSVAHSIAQAEDWRDYAGDYKGKRPYIPDDLREEYRIPYNNRRVFVMRYDKQTQ